MEKKLIGLKTNTHAKLLALKAKEYKKTGEFKSIDTLINQLIENYK